MKSSLLKKYQRLEANNDHNEAAMLLVNNFGTDDEKIALQEIIARHEKQGYISMDDTRLRFEIAQKYYKLISVMVRTK
jgi:hypothetical protein